MASTARLARLVVHERRRVFDHALVPVSAEAIRRELRRASGSRVGLFGRWS